MSHRHGRSPFGPIRTKLSFLELKKIFAQLGQHPSCGMCGYKFPEDAVTTDHECHPPMFQIEMVEVMPMDLPAGKLFSLEYTYGLKVEGEGDEVYERGKTLAQLANGEDK